MFCVSFKFVECGERDELLKPTGLSITDKKIVKQVFYSIMIFATMSFIQNHITLLWNITEQA